LARAGHGQQQHMYVFNHVASHLETSNENKLGTNTND
jgi:hypothetical protein